MKSLANEFFKSMEEGARKFAAEDGNFTLVPVGMKLRDRHRHADLGGRELHHPEGRHHLRRPADRSAWWRR